MAFRETLPKILPVIGIFSYTTTTYLKTFLELNLLIQNSLQKIYLPELYPCIPFQIKYVPFFHVTLLPPPCVECSPSPNPLCKDLGTREGGSGEIAKTLLILPTK